MLDQKLVDRLNKAKWRPTTYIRPHEYLLQLEMPILYSDAKQAILDHGVDMRFGGRLYRYLYLGDWKYWIVSSVLNRERVGGPGP